MNFRMKILKIACRKIIFSIRKNDDLERWECVK